MKKLELTLDQILRCVPALQNLVRLDLPAVTAYRLAKIANAVNVESARAGEIIDDTRNRLGVDENATDEEKKAAQEAITAELDELLGEQVEIKINPLDPSKFGDAQLKAVDLMLLDWLFIGPKEK